MSYDRSRGYFERDRHGQERVVFRPRRSSSQHRISNQEIASELEERNAELYAMNESLKTELAVVQGRNWQLTSDNGGLRETVKILKGDKEILRRQSEEKEREIVNLEDKLVKVDGKRERAEEMVERTEEKVRLMRRSIPGQGILKEGGSRERLEEKLLEVERLKEMVRFQDEQILDRDVSLAEKDKKLSYLRRWLRDRGYHVEGV